MTLAGSPGRHATRRHFARPSAAMRMSGLLLLALAVAVFASAFLATNRAAFVVSTFVALNVAHKAGWSLWAVRSGKLAGTKLLGLFATIIAVGWITVAWFIDGPGSTYFWTALVIGVLIACVSAFDATISPAEDRRVGFGPHLVDDASEFEMREHGNEHQDGR